MSGDETENALEAPVVANEGQPERTKVALTVVVTVFSVVPLLLEAPEGAPTREVIRTVLEPTRT